MGRLSSAERHWKSRLEDQTLPVEERKVVQGLSQGQRFWPCPQDLGVTLRPFGRLLLCLLVFLH
jgi:hypothetical protein